MRILIIDDDKNYTKAIKDILEEYKFECRCLENGDKAKEVIAEFKPEVVLCDLKMPHDGFNVAYNISKENKDIPVFGVTSYYNINDDHWLAKTCNFKKIFDKGSTQQLIDYIRGLQCPQT